MANEDHVQILQSGATQWNEWRSKNPHVKPDLSHGAFMSLELGGANLSNVNLYGAAFADVSPRRAIFSDSSLSNASFLNGDLIEADFRSSILSGASILNSTLYKANLSGVVMDNAILTSSKFNRANLSNVSLRNAQMEWASLVRTDLQGSDLTGANLQFALLVDSNLTNANLSDCHVYGLSAWDLRVDESTIQSNLHISPPSEPAVTVDSVEVAQFMHLLMNNKKLRQVIDVITSKVVLILGRFTATRKPTLDLVRDELRRRNYVPVMFDFERPFSRDFIETVGTLAHLARFVVADLTDPKIVLEEIPHIARAVAVPIVPILLEGSGAEPVTSVNLRVNHRSVLDTVSYKSSLDLIASIEDRIIGPAEQMARELDLRRRES